MADRARKRVEHLADVHEGQPLLEDYDHEVPLSCRHHDTISVCLPSAEFLELGRPLDIHKRLKLLRPFFRPQLRLVGVGLGELAQARHRNDVSGVSSLALLKFANKDFFILHQLDHDVSGKLYFTLCGCGHAIAGLGLLGAAGLGVLFRCPGINCSKHHRGRRRVLRRRQRSHVESAAKKHVLEDCFAIFFGLDLIRGLAVFVLQTPRIEHTSTGVD
mmetsp:Transcript_100123/g.286299  ORF Transcript_100123/g.286299 Transcript_100123/m.286299 type:complete len:217 (+) Transcript_100123:1369-2019(+)